MVDRLVESELSNHPLPGEPLKICTRLFGATISATGRMAQ
jgi:hypothetical protein